MYYCSPPPPKKNVTLNFKRKELLYDASNYAYVEADIMQVEDECRRHQVFDITQTGNVDRVTRILNLAYAECVEALYPYTKGSIPDNEDTLDDVLKEPDTYTITLSLPEGFSITTVNLLEELIHEYMVCRVLAEWLSITKKESATNWENKFSVLKEKMQKALISRRGRIRRKIKPF